MFKPKRKRKIKVIPYYRWRISCLLPYGISLIVWISMLEIEMISHLEIRVILTTGLVGCWLLGTWFIWIRADARHLPVDPRL